MKQLLSILAISGAVALTACNNAGSSSSSTEVTPTPTPVPSIDDIYTQSSVSVPLSSQVRTPASSSFNGVPRTSYNMQLFKASSSQDECFSILDTNGITHSITTNPSQWWSTAALSFSVKNTCETAQKMQDFVVKINGFKINGQPTVSVGDVAQSGQGPWMGVASKVQGDDINVVLNTPSCDGDYCSWADIPANSVRTYTINTSLGAMITSATATSVTIDGDTPLPPLPVVEEGDLSVKIDTTKLVEACKLTTCNIKINVLDPSHQISQRIQLNPVESSLYTVAYSGLLPGNYTMAVDKTTLPDGASQDYSPVSGISTNA